MTSSGTYNFFLNNGELILEAFDRIGIRPAEITRERMFSCRRSINLEMQEWAIKGINLWAVYLYTIPLVQGVATYSLPATTMDVLDTYRRQFQLTNALTGALFSTVANSTTVTVEQPAHGLTAGQFINLQTPVAVGGIVLSGFYQIASVVDINNFTITAANAATSTVSLGGVTALFTASAGSSNLLVTLANHGLVVGSQFNVPVNTTIAGITLSGSYTVLSVPDANDFYIAGPYQANASTTEYMNAGTIEFVASTLLSQPTDIYMTPMSRTDYAMQSNKFTQAPPTSIWFDKLTPTPSVTLWPTPDGTGPYLLSMYLLRQLQDVNLLGSETADIPFRFQNALCAGLTAKLAEKFAPERLKEKQDLAGIAYGIAGMQDRERVDLNLTPECAGYFKGC